MVHHVMEGQIAVEKNVEAFIELKIHYKLGRERCWKVFKKLQKSG